MIQQMSQNDFYSEDRMPNAPVSDNDFLAMGEPHMACVLLLDTSASMNGASINSLNNAIRNFKTQVCQDEIARKRVEVAVVTFSEEAEVVQNFVPIEKMPEITLISSGRTNMADGINLAIDVVKERVKKYQAIGIPSYKPWIFMITDGAATSTQTQMEQAARRIKDEEEKGAFGRLKFWALGVDNYEKTQLFMLTKRVIELRQHNFTSIFDWLSESMSAISVSQVGEDVHLGYLPEDARKAREDRDVNEGW